MNNKFPVCVGFTGQMKPYLKIKFLWDRDNTVKILPTEAYKNDNFLKILPLSIYISIKNDLIISYIYVKMMYVNSFYPW